MPPKLETLEPLTVILLNMIGSLADKLAVFVHVILSVDADVAVTLICTGSALVDIVNVSSSITEVM